jgi:hypothetical protein
MVPFNGFEQILMAVIKETHHFDDRNTDPDIKIRQSDEQRFDNAMHAIFGDYYVPRFKDAADFTSSELMQIRKLIEDGKKFRASIRKVMQPHLPSIDGSKADKSKYNEGLERLVQQARKHFKHHKIHYEEFLPIDPYDEMEKSSYLGYESDAHAQREKIFHALREAGWNI